MHDKFKEYPPASESIALAVDWFNECQRDLAERQWGSQTRQVSRISQPSPAFAEASETIYSSIAAEHTQSNSESILPSLIRSVFQQEAEMTPYIQFNTGKRTKANNGCENGFLIYNALFDNTILITCR